RELRVVDAPINPDRRTVPADDKLVAGTVRRVAFVEEIGAVREHHKTVSEAARNPELPAIVFRQFDSDVAAERGATDAYVHDDVAHPPAHHRDKLSLRVWVLQVQPAQYPMRRARQIVLNERPFDTMRLVSFDLECLKKETALIAKQFRLYDKHIGDFGLSYN